jgi:UDP-3-O-[3-hydroxymyristoyl] glucosamine N-acyltransferase
MTEPQPIMNFPEDANCGDFYFETIQHQPTVVDSEGARHLDMNAEPVETTFAIPKNLIVDDGEFEVLPNGSIVSERANVRAHSIGLRVIVHAGTSIDAPCSIGNGTTVGPESVVHDTTIGPDVVIGKKAQIAKSGIRYKTSIGDNVTIQNTNVDAYVTIGKDTRLVKSGVGEQTSIGDCALADCVTIGRKVTVGNNTQCVRTSIESFAAIGDRCLVRGPIGSDAKIGNNVIVNQGVSVERYAQVGDDAIIAAEVGSSAFVVPGSHVQCNVPEGAVVVPENTQYIVAGKAVIDTGSRLVRLALRKGK